ncbi:MAG TPA: ankyrin repeat domain-containing protein [Candidatus Angelobacter sp.]|nr:ankyrin repeat domain-containing protein [Candidatus Angelobacter sp.]
MNNRIQFQLMALSLIFALITLFPSQAQPAATHLPQASQPSYKGTQSEQLMQAVRAGDIEKCKALLAAGANPDGDFLARMPILDAVEGHNREIVRLLAMAGANLNRIDGPGLLLNAVELNDVEMVRLLLSLGANPNGSVEGQAPLHSALWFERRELAKILIAAGANAKAEMDSAQRQANTNVIRTLQEVLGEVPAPIPPEQIVNALETQWSSRDTDGGTIDSDRAGRTVRRIMMTPRETDAEKTWQVLAAQVREKPQDRNTLMLWARLQLADSFGWMGNQRTASPSAEEALDRVLAAHPHDAEALYYKGRLYGFPITVSSHSVRRKDLDKAVECLRRAVEYAPQVIKYREALAYFLTDQGRPGEAKTILQAAKKDHPLIPLLADLESVPVPPHVEFVTADAVGMMLMMDMGSEAGLSDNPNLRTRTYSAQQQDRSDIETFYRTHWPAFHWIPDWGAEPHAPGDNKPPLLYRQFLQGGPGAWEPSRDLEEIMRQKKNGSGIMITFFDLHAQPGTESEPDYKDLGRYLFIQNYRRRTPATKDSSPPAPSSPSPYH